MKYQTTFQQFNLVKQMLAEGYTVREAAEIAEVTVGTATRIRRQPADVHIEGDGYPTQPDPGCGQVVLHHPLSRVARCPICGHMVYLPCLACQLRAGKHKQPGVRYANRYMQEKSQPPNAEITPDELAQRVNGARAAKIAARREATSEFYEHTPYQFPAIATMEVYG